MLSLQDHNDNAKVTEKIPEPIRQCLLKLLHRLEKDDVSDQRVLMSDKSDVDESYYSENSSNGVIAIKTSLKNCELRLLFLILSIIIDRTDIDFFNHSDLHLDAHIITLEMIGKGYAISEPNNRLRILSVDTVIIQPELIRKYDKLMTGDYESWLYFMTKHYRIHNIRPYVFPHAIGSVFQIEDLLEYLYVKVPVQFISQPLEII